MALISAHQLGAGRQLSDGDALPALRRALALDCEYVEFDLQVTRDGFFVVAHDHHVSVDGTHRRIAELTLVQVKSAVPTLAMYDEVLVGLRGRKKAHLDLKFVATPSGGVAPSADLAAAQRAVEVLGADNVVVTTGDDAGIGAIRAWSASACPELLVGLSLGRSRRGLPLRRQLAGRLSELFPARRFEECDANVVVANRWLALLGVARWAARQKLPLLVWTVDDRRGLANWLGDPRVWMVTTNRPAVAAEIRRSLG